MNRPVPALVLAACLLTAACGGAATASPTTTSPSPAPPSTAVSASLSTASASPPIASIEPSAVASGDGAALCAFLQSEIPAVQKAGSTGGAVAQLAIDYANWISADSSRVLPDAAAMDTLTGASCPDVRASILKIIGGDSFANSF